MSVIDLLAINKLMSMHVGGQYFGKKEKVLHRQVTVKLLFRKKENAFTYFNSFNKLKKKNFPDCPRPCNFF